MACQTAIAKRGVAVLIVPVDISHSSADDDVPYSIHTSVPIVRPSDADLDRDAAILNAGDTITIYGGSGCRDAHEEVVTPPKIELEAAYGMMLYSTRAILHGQTAELFEMVKENI